MTRLDFNNAVFNLVGYIVYPIMRRVEALCRWLANRYVGMFYHHVVVLEMNQEIFSMTEPENWLMKHHFLTYVTRTHRLTREGEIEFIYAFRRKANAAKFKMLFG